MSPASQTFPCESHDRGQHPGAELPKQISKSHSICNSCQKFSQPGSGAWARGLGHAVLCMTLVWTCFLLPSKALSVLLIPCEDVPVWYKAPGCLIQTTTPQVLGSVGAVTAEHSRAVSCRRRLRTATTTQVQLEAHTHVQRLTQQEKKKSGDVRSALGQIAGQS